MARFNLDDYETVETRLEKFWGDHPEGMIHTDLVAYSDKQFIVRAEIYFSRDGGLPVSTGYAEEIVSTKGVNQESALENCETSAIGRGLANCGYAAKGKRPSREEMEKVERGARAAAAAPITLDDKEMANLAAVIAATPMMDQEGLRQSWRANNAALDVQTNNGTLREAILAAKAALEAEAAA